MNDARTARLFPAPSHTETATGAACATEAIAAWIDQHAIAVDQDGTPVSSLFLADEVIAYRIDGQLITADSGDGQLRELARQLSPQLPPQISRPHPMNEATLAPLHHALDTLRQELRQQPSHT